MKMSNKRKANTEHYNENSSDDDYDYEIPDDSIHDGNSSSKANSVIGSSIDHSENEHSVRRRGRGPSKRPCTNRNALMARKNRQKKKEYIENIENKLTYYRNENAKFVNILKKQDIDIKRLNAEVLYLKNVLKNNTSITALLNSMNSALNKRSCGNQDDSYDNSVVINNKVSDDVRKATMVNEWMNHATVPVNHENIDIDNKGRDSDMKTDYLISVMKSDHSYAMIKQENDELFDFEGVNCDLRPSGMTLSEHDDYSINSKSTPTTAATSPPTSLTSLLSPSLSNSCDMDRFNAEILEDEPPMMLLNNDDNLSDDYFKCDSNNLFDTDDLLRNLDTGGICLHVNANKISLEFCSICHLNSINYEDL